MKTSPTVLCVTLLLLALLARAQEKTKPNPLGKSAELQLALFNDVDDMEQAMKREQEEFERKIADCTARIKAHPDDATLYYQRGRAYLSRQVLYAVPADSNARAFADFTEAIRLNPDYSDAYEQRARMEQGAKAIDDYTQMIRINPNNADAYMLRATAHRTTLVDEPKAIADYGDAVRLNPELTIAYLNLAVIYIGKKDWRKVIDNYTLAIQHPHKRGTRAVPADFETNDALKGRADAYIQIGEPDKAIADYSTVIQGGDVDGNGPGCGVYLKRGELWRAKGDNARALADFNTAVEQTNGDEGDLSFAYEDRAEIYTAMGDKKKALASLLSALDVEPNAGIYLSLGLAHYGFGQYDKTIADCNTALTTCYNPEGDARAYDIIGVAYAAKGDKKKAAENFRQAVESGKEVCEVSEWKNPFDLDELAAAEARLGRFTLAVKHQQMALDLAAHGTYEVTADYLKGMKQRLALYEKGKPWLEEKQYE